MQEALKRIEPGGAVAVEVDGATRVVGAPDAVSPSRRTVAAELMRRSAARCIDQLIRRGYVQRRDVEDLRRVEREYRAAMEEA
jgi:multidrug resistance efflux pump